ncbi:hypothetical protein FHS91_002514 [Sphingobium xanthum]|uniref:DUF2130 domain-containing protein n=1 Tax=Sphingobium xanthum TaxID=1387165 RepID=UPI001C8B74B9|nr:DUF2130 domain-containing protein [Sphingobium xanthum]
MASANPSPMSGQMRPTIVPHTHPLDDDLCPTCEQPLPHDRAIEIRERLASRERERAAEISAKLEARFSAEKAEALQQAARDAELKVASARDEARSAAEAAAREKIDAAERAKADAATAQEKAQTELADLKANAVAREAEIRAEAERTANTAAEAKVAEADAKRVASETQLKGQLAQVEADKIAAQDARTALEAQHAQAVQKHADTIEQMQQDAVFREAEIRRETTEAAEAAAQEKVSIADAARSTAEETARTALAEVQSLKDSQESTLQERLSEMREAMESDKTEAVNAEKAAAYEATLKLSAKVTELQRALEKKTADELGEGAEIILHEALKAEFDGDRIERVKHGLPGADIIHTVIHNGKECGKIIYDSKNHGAWRNEFVSKLKVDQMAAKAEHAILTTSKFPAGGRQLQIVDGVIVANPARIVAIVQMVRQHLIQTHTLRLSGEHRTHKTQELYDFITSERCGNLLGRFDAHATSLLELQDRERRAHETHWKQQGILIGSVQKVSAELIREIDEIIAGGETPEATT